MSGPDGARGAHGYYGQPVLKQPTWKGYIPAYFYCGGLAAGSSLLAAGADLIGDAELARACRVSALGALTVGTTALVADLGKPSRFHHMLRVFRPTSPMNVGSWLLAAYGPAVGVAAASELVPAARPFRRVATWGAAAMAPAIATYTAVLVADTAIPAWHDVRARLPFLFAAGAAASAGGVACAVVPQAVPAQRFAIAGATSSAALSSTLHSGLPREVAQAYESRRAKTLRRVALAGTLGGAALVAAGRHRPRLARAGGVVIAIGALAERFAVVAAGHASAASPEATIAPQRARRPEPREPSVLGAL
jgi:polysulfide reductase-like protein